MYTKFAFSWWYFCMGTRLRCRVQGFWRCNSGVSPYAAFVGVFCRPIEWTAMAPISICVYLYFRLAMEKHLAFLRKHCRLCGKSVKRNVNLILFVHLLLYLHTKLSTKLRNSCLLMIEGLFNQSASLNFSLFYGSWHSSQATAMFLAFLQDFIAYMSVSRVTDWLAPLSLVN